MRSTATAYPSTSDFHHVPISLTAPCEPHPSNSRRYLDIDRIETLRSQNLKFRNEINFTYSEAWKDIYAHVELPKFFPEGTGMDDGDTVYSTASNHFRLRRVMLPAFSEKALRQQEPLIRVYVDLLMEKLRAVAD
jgi:cytochrome P450